MQIAMCHGLRMRIAKVLEEAGMVTLQINVMNVYRKRTLHNGTGGPACIFTLTKRRLCQQLRC